MQSESDWKFWQWLLTTALATVGGLIGGAWVSRGVLEELRQKDAALELRLAALEKTMEAIHSLDRNLAVLAALSGEMKADVKEIFDRLNRRTSDQPHIGERRIDTDETKK